MKDEIFKREYLGEFYTGPKPGYRTLGKHSQLTDDWMRSDEHCIGVDGGAGALMVKDIVSLMRKIGLFGTIPPSSLDIRRLNKPLEQFEVTVSYPPGSWRDRNQHSFKSHPVFHLYVKDKD